MSESPTTSTSGETGKVEVPSVPLPFARMALAMVLVGVGMTGLGMAVTMAARPGGQTAAMVAPWGAVGVHLLVLLGLAPWQPRSLARWPFAILLGSVGSLGLVVLVLMLLYFAAPLDGLTLALSIASSWFAAFFAEVLVYGHYVKRFEGVATG